MEWTADRYAGEAPPIRWLCRGTIPLGVPVLVAAMGGLGKSYLALDLALHTAAGVIGPNRRA
jgi:RecA-family ATPase